MADKKVYGVKGMMEWHALIPVGKNMLNVKFTGGTLTGYGVTPAKFITANAVVQKMIENSDAFKRGKIKLLRVYEEEKKEIKEVFLQDEKKVVNEVQFETIEVTSLDDAKELLRNRFGVPWNKLKSKSSIIETAQLYGVEFVFK